MAKDINLNILMEQCSICLEDMIQINTYVIELECNHKFHNTCIEIWILYNPTCPLCRDIININHGPFIIILYMLGMIFNLIRIIKN